MIPPKASRIEVRAVPIQAVLKTEYPIINLFDDVPENVIAVRLRTERARIFWCRTVEIVSAREGGVPNERGRFFIKRSIAPFKAREKSSFFSFYPFVSLPTFTHNLKNLPLKRGVPRVINSSD
jgi:hypothetical protein